MAAGGAQGLLGVIYAIPSVAPAWLCLRHRLSSPCRSKEQMLGVAQGNRAAAGAGMPAQPGPAAGAAGGAGSACSLLCFLLEFQLNKRLSGGVCSVAVQILQPFETCLKSVYVNTDGRVAHPFLPSCILEF